MDRGPILSLNLLGQPMVVINSHKIAVDLLGASVTSRLSSVHLPTCLELIDRRANIYNDRPRMIVVHELITEEKFISAMNYGDLSVFLYSQPSKATGWLTPGEFIHRWRRHRRAAHEGFSLKASKASQAIQVRAAVHTALGMLSDPEQWEHHIERYVPRLTLHLTSAHDSF